MNPLIAYKSYQRRFLKPLRTAHGEWSLREGFIVQIQQNGEIHYSEVAPIPDFGTETLAAAREFLEQRSRDTTLVVPLELPCCGFGLSAVEPSAAEQRSYAIAGLLPAGAAVIAAAEQKVAAGFEVLKLKIGVEPVTVELELLQLLLERLPAQVHLRLDANGGLNATQLAQWLELLAAHPAQIEYLEQPLPVGQEAEMAAQMQASGVAIALDESLNGPAAETWLQNWAGPLVIKPALMGDLAQQIERLQPVAARVVLSSVFETRIGLEMALRLADQLPDLKYALGFDTVAAFCDGLNFSQLGPQIKPSHRSTYDPQKIWNRLPPLS